MAVGTLVFDQSAYRNVVCLGHILAEDGRKMSKHLGNILEPIPLMDRHGADAVRWFMAAAARRGRPPGRAQGAGGDRVQGAAHVLVGRLVPVAVRARQRLDAGAAAQPADERTLLDRWALVRDHTGWPPRSTPRWRTSTRPGPAGRSPAYIDDLSNWYVRRSRRRFWDGDPAALPTLHECLDVLTRLLAPFVPFVTERVWRALFAGRCRVGRVGAPGDLAHTGHAH